MSKTTRKNKDEKGLEGFARAVRWDDRMSKLKQDYGIALPLAMGEFVKRSAYQSYRMTMKQLFPEPLGKIGQVRDRFIDRLRTGLQEVRFLEVALGMSGPWPNITPARNAKGGERLSPAEFDRAIKQGQPWLREAEVLKVLDKDAILNLIRMCLWFLPPTTAQEYADTILRQLEPFYAGRTGSRIVMLREIAGPQDHLHDPTTGQVSGVIQRPL